MALKFARLTRPVIRKLHAGKRLTEHGVTAEKLENGDVRYSVNVMVDGRRLHRVVGKDSEGVTRSQAEQLIERLRTEARENRLSLPKGRKTPLGFSQAADKYIELLKEEGGRNIPRKRMHLTNHLKLFFKEQRLDILSEFTIGRYRMARQRQGASDATVNRELTTLIHMLNRAVAWKWIGRLPFPTRGLKVDEGEGRRDILTDEEADALLQAAIQDQDTFLWLFVAFGFHTAMRHSEILSARFDQIDFPRLRLFIPEAKAGSREQPITPELADILRREREMRDDRDGWIFPALRPGLSADGHRTRMDRPFQRAVKRAGLDPAKVTPHVMRHTAITNLVTAGADLATVQRISGHKTLAMVMRYSHPADRHVDQAIRTLGRTLPEPGANETANTVTQELHILPKRTA